MESLSEYVNYILSGDLVAIPTETVYGLGGNAYDKSSVLKIYKAKARPLNNPLICHVYSFEFAEKNVFELSSRTEVIYKILTDRFWPGPLTIIAKKRPEIADEITISGKVGVRCPNNYLTLNLLKILQVPIAAPSANRSGHISPTTPEHVLKEFDQEFMDKNGIKVRILDGGECCNVGVESTVLEYNEETNQILIYRFGAISKDQIQKVLLDFVKDHYWIREIDILYIVKHNESKLDNYVKNSVSVSPGMDIKHYSPIVSTKLVVIVSDTSNYKSFQTEFKNIVLVDIGSRFLLIKNKIRHYFSLCDIDDYNIACRNLFSTLHKAEDVATSDFCIVNKVAILIAGFEKGDDISLALWDRIYRASCGEIVYCNIEELSKQDELGTFYRI
ncbi:Sua5/YciO/YrdC/YwlC family protein [Cryptosporidium felis]|nr:Sua5/YciO/YrdC/YwlC family protein [Cryptosporidium felis]